MPHPRVSILLPVLNEERFIDACIGSLATQEYPGEIEVIVVDGGSTDATLDRLATWKTKLPLLNVIDNPDRVQSAGLNRAAERATGEILIRADAHTTYAPDYVTRSVETLLESGATVVGGVQLAAAQNGFAAAVAEAMRLPLATGPAPFRHATEPTEADTVYLGAFRKSDWTRLGGWRTLPSNVAEDADLYYRWRGQGAAILVDPAIRSSYTPRDTVTGLWRQYYRYGKGKADMLYVNREWPSSRPLAPLALVLGLVVGLILAFTWSWWPILGLLILWVGALAAATKARPLVMLAGVVMHLAYGLGLTVGLLRTPPSVRRQVV